MRWLTKPKPHSNGAALSSPLALQLNLNPNVMLDIETMGTGPTAAIVSIGAAKFDANDIIETFSVNVDLQSCLDHGLTMDAGTVYWWMNREDAARRSLMSQCKPMEEALQTFADWIDVGSNVWGNGCDFDNVILANAYRSCGMDLPFAFFRNRCYRTLKSLHPNVQMIRVGVAHNALDDAVGQAKHLIEIAKVSA